MKNPSIRNIILIWLGWSIMMIGFQHWIGARVDLVRPDYAVFWTPGETTANSQNNKPTLLDPFMNEQVAWDSEFYLSIASVGYDDPAVRGIASNFSWSNQNSCIPRLQKNCVSLSYAFFPLYPWTTWLVAQPLRVLPLTVIARTTLAAVIVSLLGALGAMLGLYFMSRKSLGEDGSVRAAFYLLIFPSGFFLAQVYTEGLFLGLTFGALAFLSARKWGWAALLAALAVWARPGGAILFLPMAVIWLKEETWFTDWKTMLSRSLATLAPALSYAAWSLTPLADKFHFVEKNYFGRGFLVLDRSITAWRDAFATLSADNSQAAFYYTLEFAAVTLAVLACLLLLKERPELSLFGLAMIFFAFTSGSSQGMVRYVLAAPALFWVLARWGRHPVFDRVWTVLSLLLLGLEAMLFSFNFWVA